jgi:hypothetical protein
LFTVTQRAETQQNMRAAIELMTKDLSMAGAGLPTGGLQLANKPAPSKVACNQSGTLLCSRRDVYPNSGIGVAINYMYPSCPDSTTAFRMLHGHHQCPRRHKMTASPRSIATTTFR